MSSRSTSVMASAQALRSSSHYFGNISIGLFAQHDYLFVKRLLISGFSDHRFGDTYADGFEQQCCHFINIFSGCYSSISAESGNCCSHCISSNPQFYNEQPRTTIISDIQRQFTGPYGIDIFDTALISSKHTILGRNELQIIKSLVFEHLVDCFYKNCRLTNKCSGSKLHINLHVGHWIPELEHNPDYAEFGEYIHNHPF
ncbi:hypothetical protein CGMCC3_g9175 [Colletotrichum fructicola]|nr:uncharacterized protein CGMCC3_g9175 [Colletotrichum fructicola]KAE9574671.1 hypothetical protein CGMCC3_g9175 [Colletotrichum fructicola]KAF4432831.1 hypothetical protein CFRS1_v008001 [Colletotrichum fructicola]KAF5513119.1 hypothetical protein CGCF413_v000220 [Colletotrichum fructicola]